MNINGVGNTGLVKLYSDNSVKPSKEVKKSPTDSIQISKAGKSLSAFATDETIIPDEKKVQAIKDSITNGTYNNTRTSELVAKKILNYVKGRTV